MKYGFFIDLITLLPLFLSLSQFSEYFDIFFSLRIVKVEGIIKRIEEFLQLRGKKEGIFQLIKLMAFLFFLTHLSACIWHFVAQYEISNGFETNWLQVKSLQNEPWMKRYIYSLYFSLVTMMTVGYGDITIQNETECVVNIFMIIYGCVVFAYTISDIGVIFKEMYQEEKEFKLFFILFLIIFR